MVDVYRCDVAISSKLRCAELPRAHAALDASWHDVVLSGSETES